MNYKNSMIALIISHDFLDFSNIPPEHLCATAQDHQDHRRWKIMHDIQEKIFFVFKILSIENSVYESNSTVILFVER
jgi:hypothetical protein